MRTTKILVSLLLILGVTGCACRTRTVGPGGDNIAAPGPGGVLRDVNFAYDSYALDGAARSTVQKNAEWLKANEGAKIQIEGHCDERGTNEYNMVLGSNRARAILDALHALGVAPGRMSTVSYGEELPLDPRHNEEAWAKNRRAHHNIMK